MFLFFNVISVLSIPFKRFLSIVEFILDALNVQLELLFDLYVVADLSLILLELLFVLRLQRFSGGLLGRLIILHWLLLVLLHIHKNFN